MACVSGSENGYLPALVIMIFVPGILNPGIFILPNSFPSLKLLPSILPKWTL